MASGIARLPRGKTVLLQIERTGPYLTERSLRFVRTLGLRMEAIVIAWLAIIGAAAALRTSFAYSPIVGPRDFAEIFLPYALAALAPVAGYRIAMLPFPPTPCPRSVASALRSMAAGSGSIRPAAVAAALQHLLHGNVTKVLISATFWLPYLLLSERVNVTYRSRVSKADN